MYNLYTYVFVQLENEIERGRREVSEIERGRREESERGYRVNSGGLCIYICQIKYIDLSNNCIYATSIQTEFTIYHVYAL